MAKKRGKSITAKQKAARRRNVAVARAAKKRGTGSSLTAGHGSGMVGRSGDRNWGMEYMVKKAARARGPRKKSSIVAKREFASKFKNAIDWTPRGKKVNRRQIRRDIAKTFSNYGGKYAQYGKKIWRKLR